MTPVNDAKEKTRILADSGVVGSDDLFEGVFSVPDLLDDDDGGGHGSGGDADLHGALLQDGLDDLLLEGEVKGGVVDELGGVGGDLVVEGLGHEGLLR